MRRNLLVLLVVLLSGCATGIVPGTVLIVPENATVELRHSPTGQLEAPRGMDDRLLASLSAGTQMTVTSDSEGWYETSIIFGDWWERVKLENGLVGWVALGNFPKVNQHLPNH